MSDDSYFKSRFTYDPERDRVWKVITCYLQKEISTNDIVLDFGAGYCNFINNIQAKEKHAVDSYPEFAKYASSDVIVHIGKCYDLSSLKSNYIDVVFSSNLLEHLSRDEINATLDEVRRVLKTQGKLILILPNYRFSYSEFYDDYTHQTPLTDISLCDWLIAKEFMIQKVIPKFLPLTFKSNLPKHPLLVKIYLMLPFKPYGKQMLIIARKEK